MSGSIDWYLFLDTEKKWYSAQPLSLPNDSAYRNPLHPEQGISSWWRNLGTLLIAWDPFC